MEERRCSKCKKIKPLPTFGYKASKGVPVLMSLCEACRDADKTYRRNHKDRITERNKRYWKEIQKNESRHHELLERGRHRRLQFCNTTPEEYQALLEKQNGACAICGKFETSKLRGRTRNLAIDHDHITGRVRGLLCFRCNTNLAVLEDQGFVRTAHAYLAEYGSEVAR